MPKQVHERGPLFPVEGLRLHRPTGQGYFLVPDPVRGGRRRVYVGRLYRRGELVPETLDRARRWLAEWAATGSTAPPPRDSDRRRGATVAEIVAAFLRDRERFASRTELSHFRRAFDVLLELYGDSPAEDFGPRALKAVRERMVADGRLNRRMLNSRVERIRMAFRHGVADESVPAHNLLALEAVEAIRFGQEPRLREPRKVDPAPAESVEAVLPLLSAQVAAIVQLMLATGARCGEVVEMRPGDIERSAETWIYAPRQHKGSHRGIARRIYLGPRAREVLRPWLLRPDDAPCFQPREAEDARREALSRARATPEGRGNRPGSNRRENPKRRPGETYSTDSVRRAIHRACDRLGIERWSPHQLRHGAGTRFEHEAGFETARLLLGHRSVSTTAIYAERDERAAREAAERLG